MSESNYNQDVVTEKSIDMTEVKSMGSDSIDFRF